MSSFEEGLTQLMMQMEELKRSLSSDEHVEQWQLELEAIVEQLDFLMRKMLDDPASDVKKDMYAHCQQRVMETCRVVLCHVTAPQANRLVFDFYDMKGQAAIARMMELSLLIEVMKDSTSEKNGHPFTQEMINMYANYQKAVLRQRCKPAIAHLAHWRKNPVQKNAIAEEDDENHIVHPHSNAITVILGQASALIHPLLLWKSNLTAEIPVHQMCHATITILNEQAQSLVKTVSDWFFEDKRLDEWMEQTVDPQRANVDLAELDGLVEEMAFSSQVLARYNALMQQENTSQNTIEQELLPEWTWKYASLERFLGMQQWKSALALATPVNIVVGSDIKVPSVVEDAQYLSSRALDRATSTLSSLAMGTVAHSLSNDIWSTDIPGGVYQALMDQRGCWIAPDVETTKQERKTKDSFASALLDALDDDIKSPKSPPRTASAPASGGFLGSLSLGGGQQALLLRLDTNLCKLNGIFSASAACKSLAQSLDAWLSHEDNEKTMSMIQLAREELERYSQTYAQILELHVKSSLLEWCGSLDEPSQRKKMCIHDLREFFWEEDFELDNDSFIKAESDARLEKVLLDPLRESPLISQLSKCDYEVSLIICQELSILVADLVIRSLWGYNKVFTDWGSLLLSKQVRMLQRFIEKLVEAAQDAPPVSFVVQFEKLSQVVTILQLERPSDWCIYQSTSVLTVQELRQTMSLHKSFSAEAIAAICQSG